MENYSIEYYTFAPFMRGLYLISIILLLAFSTEDPDFEKKQANNQRVQEAISEKWPELHSQLSGHGIVSDSFDIFIRAFKFEEDLELWVKHKDSSSFILLKSYKFCSNVGFLGPKEKQGDLQIPEGFYELSKFNPESNYHLSLKLNYPNLSDSLQGNYPDLGGMIFIHGGCHTIGCIPITDDKIKELYVLSLKARLSGQEFIPIHVYPSRLTDENMDLLSLSYLNKNMAFWSKLKVAYDLFEEDNQLPQIEIDSTTGEYLIH